jgi:peptide/nickel transport system permease protein
MSATTTTPESLQSPVRGPALDALAPPRRLRPNRPLVAGATVLALVFAGAVFAPWLTHWNPASQGLIARLLPPFWGPGGSTSHLLGTDGFGRDVFSRLLYGARYSLLIALSAVLLSGLIGVILGLLAGYVGGWVETIVMRLVDGQQALPAVLVALMVVGLFGNSVTNITLVLAITGWATYSRILFGVVRGIRGLEFVNASIALGASSASVVFRHVLPNSLSPIIVISTLQVGRMMLLEAGLSFLGLGVPESLPAWGTMLADGERNIFTAAYLTTIPGLAITFTVFGINLLGDGLRRALDPNLGAR